MAVFSHFLGFAAASRKRVSKRDRLEQEQSERDDAGQSEDLPELDPRKMEVRRASGC
jgi:hypothetical protein